MRQKAKILQTDGNCSGSGWYTYKPHVARTMYFGIMNDLVDQKLLLFFLYLRYIARCQILFSVQEVVKVMNSKQLGI